MFKWFTKRKVKNNFPKWDKDFLEWVHNREIEKISPCNYSIVEASKVLYKGHFWL